MRHLLIVLVAIVAGVYAVSADSAVAAVLCIGLLLTTAEVWVLLRAAQGFNALVIPVLTINTVLLAAMLIWGEVRLESIVSARFVVEDSDLIQAAWAGLAFTATFAFGGLLSRPKPVSLTEASALASRLSVSNGALVAVGFSTIALVAYGRQGALLRGAYLQADGPQWAVALGNSLTPLALAALSVAAFRKGHGRLLAALGIALLTLILFGRASRSLAAVPTLLVMGYFLATGARIRVHWVALAIASTIVALQIPLAARANPGGAGIISLGARILRDPGFFVEDFSLSAVLGNILFSGPLTAVVANREIDPSTLWLSLNPAPGAWTDWPSVSRSLKIDQSTPYNALGELAAHGWLTLLIVGFGVGLAVGLATRVAAATPGRLGMVSMLIVLAVVAFFSVSVLQYNLRSSVRLIYYVLFGVAVLKVVAATLQNSADPAHSPTTDRSGEHSAS